jgi:hypothetical protein
MSLEKHNLAREKEGIASSLPESKQLGRLKVEEEMKIRCRMSFITHLSDE